MHTARLRVLIFLVIAFGASLQAEAQTCGPVLPATETVPGASSKVASAGRSPPVSGSSIGRTPAGRPPGDKPIIWFGGGLGLGGAGGSSGQLLAGHLELSLHGEGPNIYMARASLVTDILDYHGWELGLLYGRATGPAAVLAGVALTEHGNGAGSTSTVGLTLQGRLRLFTLGPWGLGLTAFANVNRSSSFGGLSLTLELGNF